MPQSTEVSSFLDKPGWFHFAIVSIDEQPVSKKNELMDAIRPSLTVLNGTDASQVKRTTAQLLNNPSEAHSDGGEFAARVQARFAKACGILPAAKPGEMVEIDWQRAIGMQVVALIKMDKGDKGEFPKIDGAHIYSLDDADCAHVPLAEAAVNLMPGMLAKVKAARAAAGYGMNGKPLVGGGDKASTTATTKPTPASTNGNGNGHKRETPPTAAAAVALSTSNSDLDDLLS